MITDNNNDKTINETNVNEDMFAIDEPYDIELYSNSVASSVVSNNGTFVENIDELPMYELLTNVNRTIKSNKLNKFIVVHWVGAVSTALNNAKYFKDVNRNASANYFVDDTSIYRVVRDTDVAWHCGGGLQGPNGHTFHNICFNSNSIGIEMCCKKSNGVTIVPESIMNNTVKLIIKLMNQYNIGIDRVIRHYDVTGKLCPGDLLTDESWNAFKMKIINAMDSHESKVKKFLEKGIINTESSWINPKDWIPVKNALAIIDKNTGNGMWASDEANISIHWCHPHLISLCGKQVIEDKDTWYDFDAWLSYARGLALLTKVFDFKKSDKEVSHWGWSFANALIDNDIITSNDIPSSVDMDAPMTNELFVKIFAKFLNI